MFQTVKARKVAAKKTMTNTIVLDFPFFDNKLIFWLLERPQKSFRYASLSFSIFKHCFNN